MKRTSEENEAIILELLDKLFEETGIWLEGGYCSELLFNSNDGISLETFYFDKRKQKYVIR